MARGWGEALPVRVGSIDIRQLILPPTLAYRLGFGAAVR